MNAQRKLPGMPRGKGSKTVAVDIPSAVRERVPIGQASPVGVFHVLDVPATQTFPDLRWVPTICGMSASAGDSAHWAPGGWPPKLPPGARLCALCRKEWEHPEPGPA